MKFRLFLHLLGQIVAQTAVVSLVPDSAMKYWTAGVAILGVLIAFFDNSAVSPVPPQGPQQ